MDLRRVQVPGFPTYWLTEFLQVWSSKQKKLLKWYGSDKNEVKLYAGGEFRQFTRYSLSKLCAGEFIAHNIEPSMLCLISPSYVA